MGWVGRSRGAGLDDRAAHRAFDRVLKENPECAAPGFDYRVTIPFYAEARRKTRETGIAHEVDHIKALCNGGKHAVNNLQVITAKENRVKGTRTSAVSGEATTGPAKLKLEK